MSNLTGNYKISLGEVQGVDVIREREQERRARMQLLDDIREPSPQPIFGEPVKVDLEDETSRRIKNTLGDFTQVLTNDPKNLIGISRSTGSGHQNGHQSNGYTATGHPVNGYSGSMPYSAYSSNGHSTAGHPSVGNSSMGHSSAPFARPQAAFKKQHYPANGTSTAKQSMPNYVAPKAPDKRVNYNRSDKSGYNYKSESPAAPKSYHSSSGTPQAPYLARDPASWESNKEQRRANVPPNPFNINVNAESNVTINNITMCNNSISTSAPIWNCGPDTPAIQINPFHLPSNATPSNPAKTMGYGQNTTVYATNSAKTDSEKVTSTPPKRNQFRPSSLKIQPGKKEAPMAVETILKVMTKAVPPAPLTAIQTPRTEETGFAFPAEPKEVRMPIHKLSTTAIDWDTSFFKGIEQISLIQPFDDDLKPDPEPKDVSQHSSKPYVSSLQDDLEMSDSDEEAVPEVKSNPDQFLQSPVSDIATSSTTTLTTTAPIPTVSTNSDTKMDANSAESSNSSSSESGDSDSDDSSSESNDSDSSSEASDEEISSKKWGLSNFVDESQRMHSPRFFQADAAAKGTLRLHTERMKSLAMGNINTMTGTSATIKDPLPLPVTEQTSTFLVPEVPVAAKSEIISPIPSPIHAAVGPRTPPSPSCALNQDCPEINEDDNIQIVKSPEKTVPDTIDPPIPNSPHSDTHLSSDLSEQKGYVQNEKCKKQLRSCSAKMEELNEHESSPRDSFVELNNIFKESFEISSEKESAATEIEKSTSNSLTSENVEPSPDNYSIKTRQRGSAASSVKKNKSSENSQKADGENSSAIAKLKHPRACRKPNEKQVKKAGTNITSTKPDNVEQPRKRCKSETKENKSGSERVVDPVKSSGSVKTVKSARKSKTAKVPQKEVPEIKKSEPKKKKFAIENFVQSPEISRPATASQIFSPSPERSPLPECEKGSSESATQSSVLTTVPTKAPSKTNLKSTEACKNVEKLRRSVRCSERASNNAQSDASSTPRASSESKKSLKNLSKTKCRVENLLSIEGVDRLELLSPIPMDPSVSTETPNSAIPMKIMVCIPFAKLLRLPSGVQQPPEAENIQGYRSRSASIDEGKSQKDSVSSDQSTKAVTAKRSVSKEVKDKTKTINPLKSSKSNIKNVSSIKKDKDVKSTSEASSKSKTVSSVNKSSIKIKSKTYCDDTENTLPKKRKNESKDQQILKKKKISSRVGEEKKLKESPSVIKSDSTANIEEASKTKILERCDSTGSLSSLCSQQSQRSSKSSKEKKKDPSGGPESKRIKSSTPVLIKDIKQEKEDRPKVHIKKEPRTSSDKSKVKSRDKTSTKDISCAEKFGEIWDDSLTSSQFFRWDEQCNDDSKGKLVTNQSLEDADRALADWDHFAPDMHKVMKEASTLNKHNNQAPIMPMDYYYTEGRKQKQIAEKEKDPFQQAVKYFEAAVLFILTSQQKEEYTKDPQAIYQFYEKTLKYFGDIQTKVKGLQSCPGSTEFKLLILCLKCQSLLNVKLYNIKIKEIKEQTDFVTEFLRNYTANAHNLPLHPRHSNLSSAPSPHSTIPSPASSVSTQTSVYGSGITGTEICLRSNIPGYVNVPQNVLDMICRQHTHLINLHRGHDNWEQADMYMTRSNLREFFKEVADQSEPLTLHSSITELVKYIQKGISLVKKSLR